MKLSEIWAIWKAFWFAPRTPTAIAIFRILHGLLVLEYCVLIAPQILVWFGRQGVLSMATAEQLIGTPNLNLLALLPNDDRIVITWFGVFAIAACFLTLGLFTRLSAAIVYVGLATLHHRNSLIINSGDVLLKLCAFYLVFSAAGHAFSLDRLLQRWKKLPAAATEPAPESPWAQRLIQLQIAAVYFQAFWSKLEGQSWLDGTAIYNVLREVEFLRFPVPFVADNLVLCQILSWGTLVIEGSMWTLVWIKETRYFALAGATMLHLGIDYTMNLPIFEWLMISALVIFIPSEDLDRLIERVKERVRCVRNSQPA